MNFEKYSLDELDLEFLMYVQAELFKSIGSDAVNAIISSGLLERLQQDPIYVHHFDEQYWAEYVLRHFRKRELVTN